MLSEFESYAVVDLVQTFRAELYAAFGAHFEFWIKQDGWTSAAVHAGPDAARSTDADLGGKFRAELDHAAAAKDKPRVVPQANGRWLLAIALPDDSKGKLVATATFSTDRPDLLERTARLAIDAFEQSRRLFQCRRELDRYASNLSKNLEELTYLCSCAEHLDLASSSPDVWRMATVVLPRLRETISAAAVVLLPAGEDQSHENPGAAGWSAQPAGVWAGKCAADEADCRSLIRQFQRGYDAQPVVRNYFTDSDESMVLRHIDSFVLAPVARSGFVVGWLLALNRVPSRSDDPANLHRAHAGLSDLEFGSVEAHLLQFTAALLAAHGRNASLLQSGAASC